MSEQRVGAILPDLSAAEQARLEPYLSKASYAAGDRIIAEGSDDRRLYIVVSGTARIERSHVEVDLAHAGDHFGEIALLTGRERTATVSALTDLELRVLTYERYCELGERDPAFALRLVHLLVGGIGEALADMTESVTHLLRERSLPRRAHVDVTVCGQRLRVRNGTSLQEVLAAHTSEGGLAAALVDRRAVSLSAPISADSVVEPLSVEHWEGRRIYRQSLALLVLEAAHALDPDLDVRVGHSLGFAQRVLVRATIGESNTQVLARLEDKMRELVAEARPLREELWTIDEARTHFEKVGWSDAVELLETWRDTTVELVSYGSVYAIRPGALLASTAAIRDFALIADDDGCLLLRRKGDADAAQNAARIDEARAASSHVERMTQQHHHWLRALGMTSVGAFNHACVAGRVGELIRVVEGFHEKRIGQIADEIQQRRDEIEFVCIAGPSSSGKTTFIKRLKVQLQVNGINPVYLSLDDYYVDRTATPRDADGELDFETFDALRVGLLQEHLGRLHDGQSVTTAHYDFQTGTSHPEGGRTLELGASDIVMLEGIHGLNPRLLHNLPERCIFRIYICPLAQLPFERMSRVHASDIRLLRRIVRDRHGRGLSAADNINRWPSVRRGESLNIYPYQNNADAVFDSSLIYEMSVLKVYAERYLLEVPRSSEAYTTALRLLQLLDRFVAIYPDHVPPTSMLREFIGGSGFEY